MGEASLLQVTLESLVLVLALSLPPIIAAAVFGIAVALGQAVTQVQEQVLAFAIKLIAVIVTLVFTAHWVGAELYRFAHRLFRDFPGMVSWGP